MYFRLLIAMVLVIVMVSSHVESKTISSDELEQKWQEFKTKFGNVITLTGNTSYNKQNKILTSLTSSSQQCRIVHLQHLSKKS